VKICIISNVSGYPWAGSEEVWYINALNAIKEGHQLTIFTHRDLEPSKQLAALREMGAVTYTWDFFPISRLSPIRQKIKPSFPVHILNQFDVILVSLGSLPALTYVPGLADSLLKTTAPIVPLVQFNADHLSISLRERQVVSQVLKKCSSVIFISQNNLRQAKRQFAVELPNAFVIANPIRTVIDKPYPWPQNEEEVRFACVARFELYWKGQDLLLDILSQTPWNERNWHLTLYGSGPDEAQVKKLVDFYGLKEKVSFGGFVDSLAEIWKEHHLLLLPSHGEGMPLSILEAMMFARPVIATDVGGNREIIKDGVYGFIAEAPTVHSFGNAMERAWAKRSEWKAMGLSAHDKSCEFVDINATHSLLDILLHVCN
jgi:glycosyltransferase involved in cell wall biosynthesis